MEPVELLGIVENTYRFEGTPGHEITFLYEVAFVDQSVYDRQRVRISEPEAENPDQTASWHTLEELLAGDAALYPEGVNRVFRGEARHVLSV